MRRKRVFFLAYLHDVESRKWNLDVLIPIIWMRLALVDLNFTSQVHLEAGDQMKAGPPQFKSDGKGVDIAAIFQQWNNGQLHTG